MQATAVVEEIVLLKHAEWPPPQLLLTVQFPLQPAVACIRRRFLETVDVREVLDFISVRGLFKKGRLTLK